MMLCSPTEPKKLTHLGKVSSVPENYGADFLIMGKKIRIGVQRKQFPGDLLASLTDGRLYDQLPRLTELDQALLVIEGHGRWTEDGELIGDSKYHSFTIQQLHGLLFTIMFEFGVPSIWVGNMDDTGRVLTNLEAWAKKDKHTSLKSRPGPGKSSWGSTSERHSAQHILQGFPGVGGELAGRIVDKFQGVPLTWTIGMDELMRVEGIGKKKADTMYHALDATGDSK
jgi:ERCC4-type nuclease